MELQTINMNGRIIVLEPYGIAEYMALSETLQSYRAPDQVTVFVSHGWTRKGVSIGERQKIGCLNLDACREDGLEVVRRHTEGYAVIHDMHDVAYGIAVPENFSKSKLSLDDGIFPVLARSLERVGVPNAYDPLPRRYGNVFVNGRKIAGSAQNTRNQTTWLQHGIVAVRKHKPEDYARYLNGEKDLVKVRSQMTSIWEESGITAPERLVGVMVEEFDRHLHELGIDLKLSVLSSEEVEHVNGLVKSKYENEKWLVSETGMPDNSGRVECFVSGQS